MTVQDPADTELHRYYARRAVEYEAIYAKPERQSDLAQLAVELSEAFRGRTVVEVACGTGYWTQHIARHAVRVDAFDINDETLAIARTKAIDPARVRFAVGDAYAVPEAAAPYDAAFAGFWWSHITKHDLPRFLGGLHRVLAPGSRIVMIDNRHVEGSSTPIARTDVVGNTWQTRQLADGTTYQVLKNFPTPDELRSAVAPYSAGTEVRLFDYYWQLDYTSR